jgi:competence protein ComEC
MEASAPNSAHSAPARNPAAPAIPAAPGDRVAERRSIPLFHAAWLFALGIAATQFVYLRPSWVLLALAPIAVLAAAAALRAQRIAWLPLAVMGILLGVWCAEMEPHPAPAAQLADASDGLMRTVEGTVVDASPVRNEAEAVVNEHNPEAAAPDPESSPQAPEIPSQSLDLRVSTAEIVNDSVDLQSPMAGGLRIRVSWPVNDGAMPAHRGCARISLASDRAVLLRLQW